MRLTLWIFACAFPLAGTIVSEAALSEVAAESASGVEHNGATRHTPAALAHRIEQLESRVAEITERQRISEVYTRYTRGFDRNDIDLMRSAFWPDVEINYGSQSNSLDEFIIRHLRWHTDSLETWALLLTNESIEIVGDVAHVETYVTGLFNPLPGKSEFALGATIASGRYVDRLDRRQGEWRIAMREFIPHFSARTESVFSSERFRATHGSKCAMGTHDKRDPSYRRPLTHRSDKKAGPACAN